MFNVLVSSDSFKDVIINKKIYLTDLSLACSEDFSGGNEGRISSCLIPDKTVT